MDSRTRYLILIAGVALPLLFRISPSIGADEPNAAMKAVQGKWVRYQQTSDGRVTIIKEHKGNTTVLTVYGDAKNVIYSHKSEFKIERSGKIHVLTFFNRKITAGPNAGHTIEKPVSFVFRVADNRFVEVYGVLEDDTSAPNLIVWERMESKAKSKDAG